MEEAAAAARNLVREAQQPPRPPPRPESTDAGRGDRGGAAFVRVPDGASVEEGGGDRRGRSEVIVRNAGRARPRRAGCGLSCGPSPPCETRARGHGQRAGPVRRGWARGQKPMSDGSGVRKARGDTGVLYIMHVI